MPTKKKDFTTADGAIDKLFTPPQNEQSQQTQDTIITNDTQHSNDANVSKPPNISKHYKERGKRAERLGLLLDEQLKEDLRHLSMAKGSKSINDFIITILLEYVEREENQAKLEQYRKLLQE